jgi:hypothetical protein
VDLGPHHHAAATNAKAQVDVARYGELVNQNVIPRETYDEIVKVGKVDAAAVNSDRAALRCAVALMPCEPVFRIELSVLLYAGGRRKKSRLSSEVRYRGLGSQTSQTTIATRVRRNLAISDSGSPS